MTSSSSPPKSLKPQDCFYVLSQSWSRSLKHHFVYGNWNLRHVNFWILHGLWLGTKTALNLSNIDFSNHTPDYEQPKDKQCLRDLKKVFPSLIQGEPDENRHKKLYEKHGRCVIYFNNQFLHDEQGLNKNRFTITTPESYLCKAAELAIKYNMGQYLREFHLGQSHDVDKMTQKIEKVVGSTPHISSLTTTNPTDDYLTEIYLYFDLDFQLTPIQNKHQQYTKTIYERCIHNLPAGGTCTDDQCKILIATHPLPEPV